MSDLNRIYDFSIVVLNNLLWAKTGIGSYVIGINILEKNINKK